MSEFTLSLLLAALVFVVPFGGSFLLALWEAKQDYPEKQAEEEYQRKYRERLRGRDNVT